MGIRRYFGGNSGYVGYSKSVRAVDAERRGLRSKSQMDSSFADEVNELLPENGKVTLKQIKSALSSIRADEWHHTSMYGNKTDYYSAETIACHFSDSAYDKARELEQRRMIKKQELFARLKEENKVLQERRKESQMFLEEHNDTKDEIIKERIAENLEKNGNSAKFIGNTIEVTMKNGVVFNIPFENAFSKRLSYESCIKNDKNYNKDLLLKTWIALKLSLRNTSQFVSEEEIREKINLSLQNSTFGILMF